MLQVRPPYMTVVVVGIVVALLIGGWSAVRAQQSNNGLESLPAWGVVPSPNGGTGPNDLLAVEVLSPTNVWAVGSYGSFTNPDPAIHHWNGTMWEVIALPDGLPEGVLQDVDAVSADDIWAVGYTQSAGDSFLLHWDGTAWSSVAHPTPYTRQSLNGVSARAANDVWVVGDYSVNGGVSLSYSMHWDGTSWTVIDVPSPNGGYSTLNEVVALAPNDVWAVGDDGDQPRAVHWDGTAWQIVPMPSEGINTEYFAISAASPTDIWAVGEGWDGHITAHWDGTAWLEVPNPAGDGYFGQLEDVVVLASDDVWAVGWQGNPWYPFAMHWDGTAWTEQSPPALPDDTRLFGVDGDSSGMLWAVGEVDASYTVRWEGSEWVRVPSANVSNAANVLQEVDALNASDAWAVGAAGGDPLTLHWDGDVWEEVPVALPNIELNGVSIVAQNDVWAVGSEDDGQSGNDNSAALHWNGSTWQRIPTPNPSPYVNRLYAVDAVATNDVWAVGGQGSTVEEPLILHWDGSSWAEIANACGHHLLDLHARAANDIWAVGRDTACHYDGTGWTPFVVPGFLDLRGVHIITPNDVWAVGSETTCGPKSCSTAAYVAHWNGSVWTTEAVGELGDPIAAALEDVFAYSSNNVWAVGTFSLGTAIAHYDGTEWQSVPAADPGSGGELNGMSGNGSGGYWAVGDYYPQEPLDPRRTLIMDAPSETQGGVFGETTYGGSTVLWIGPVTGSTVTNNSFGDYAITGLPAGSYTFIAIGDGCPPQQMPVQVYAGEHVRQDFDLCGTPPTPVPTRTPGPSPTATPAAGMMLQPPTVDVSVEAGGSAMQMVELHNMMNYAFTWSGYEASTSCSTPGSVPWFQVGPSAGTLPAHGMVELMVEIDTTGLAVGTHTAYFCLQASGQPTQMLPISVTVMTESSIRLFLPVVAR